MKRLDVLDTVVALKHVCLPALLVICTTFSLFITLGMAEHLVISSSTQFELSICLLSCLCLSLLMSCWLALSPPVPSKQRSAMGHAAELAGHADKLRYHTAELTAHAEKATRREEEHFIAESKSQKALEAALCSAVENAVVSRLEGVSEYSATAQQAKRGFEGQTSFATTFVSGTAATAESHEENLMTLQQAKQDDTVQAKLQALAREQAIAESRIDARIKLLQQEHGALQNQMKMTCYRLGEMTEDAANRTEKAQSLLLSSLAMQQQADSERLEAKVHEILDNQSKLGARTDGVCRQVTELAQISSSSQSVQEQTRTLQALSLAADAAKQQLSQPFRTQTAEQQHQQVIQQLRYPGKSAQRLNRELHRQRSQPVELSRQRSQATGGRGWSTSTGRVIPQSAWSSSEGAKWG